MVSPILELKDINKSFGHVHANKNINLQKGIKKLFDHNMILNPGKIF